jgi:hypothetical protein
VEGSVNVKGKAVRDGQFDLRPATLSISSAQGEWFNYTYTGQPLAALTRAVSLYGTVQLKVIVTASPRGGDAAVRATRVLSVLPNPPPPPPPPPKPTPLDVHDFNGNVLAITVSVFADPATPANQFSGPSSGNRLVAIEEHLTGRGPGTVSNDVNNATSLVGSNGQVYTASFNGVQGCTNFAYGAFTLSGGESETGCVVFEVPTGVSIARVKFTLTAGYGDTVQWIATG